MNKLEQKETNEIQAGVRVCAFNIWGVKLFCWYA
ncbi:hypothetical protein DOK67_0001163 [Enterococcus sp. DIV0212c]